MTRYKINYHLRVIMLFNLTLTLTNFSFLRSREWTVYNTSNSNLLSKYVNAIAIDKKSKWIGTNGGLAKFDGVNWTVYKASNSGLPYNYICGIAIDGQVNKWIGTDGELAVYREGGIILPIEGKEKAY
jgi:ligand-binding sensor domain-containing protein